MSNSDNHNASINRMKLVLERGDGQRIDIGEVPDLSDFSQVAKLIARLQEAKDNAGTYRVDLKSWIPERLQEQLQEA